MRGQGTILGHGPMDTTGPLSLLRLLLRGLCLERGLRDRRLGGLTLLLFSMLLNKMNEVRLFAAK